MGVSGYIGGGAHSAGGCHSPEDEPSPLRSDIGETLGVARATRRFSGRDTGASAGRSGVFDDDRISDLVVEALLLVVPEAPEGIDQSEPIDKAEGETVATVS
jgi:hypothetical protein